MNNIKNHVISFEILYILFWLVVDQFIFSEHKIKILIWIYEQQNYEKITTI